MTGKTLGVLFGAASLLAPVASAQDAPAMVSVLTVHVELGSQESYEAGLAEIWKAFKAKGVGAQIFVSTSLEEPGAYAFAVPVASWAEFGTLNEKIGAAYASIPAAMQKVSATISVLGSGDVGRSSGPVVPAGEASAAGRGDGLLARRPALRASGSRGGSGAGSRNSPRFWARAPAGHRHRGLPARGGSDGPAFAILLAARTRPTSTPRTPRRRPRWGPSGRITSRRPGRPCGAWSSRRAWHGPISCSTP